MGGHAAEGKIAMPPRKAKPANGAARSLEATLWDAANQLRSNMDAAEYKHVVLGLIFLKYVSDVFARRRADLERLVDDPTSDLKRASLLTGGRMATKVKPDSSLDKERRHGRQEGRVHRGRRSDVSGRR